jgi:hypothetical protein
VAAAAARCNSAKHRGAAGARVLHHTGTVANETPDGARSTKAGSDWSVTFCCAIPRLASDRLLRRDRGRPGLRPRDRARFMRPCDAELATALNSHQGDGSR